MTLKEKLEKSKALNKLSIDIANYYKAAASNPKFDKYYFGKIEEAENEMKELNGG